MRRYILCDIIDDFEWCRVISENLLEIITEEMLKNSCLREL